MKSKSNTTEELATAYQNGFPKIGSPAYFALKESGITLADLPKYTEHHLLSLHGVGPKAVKILSKYLLSNGQSFLKS